MNWAFASRRKCRRSAPIRRTAGLDDAAPFKHKDAGRIADGGEPMGNDESSAPLHGFDQRGRHLRLGRGVERAGRLVEDRDRRDLSSARAIESVTLAARRAPTALADEAFRPPWRSMMSTLGRSRASRMSVGSVGIADPQIVGDRAVEQQRFLEDHADITSQARERDVADVAAVDVSARLGS